MFSLLSCGVFIVFCFWCVLSGFLWFGFRRVFVVFLGLCVVSYVLSVFLFLGVFLCFERVSVFCCGFLCFWPWLRR